VLSPYRSRIASTSTLLVALVTLCAGCSGPTGPGIADLYFITAIVYYDENGNGTRDAEERTVVPEAQLSALGFEREVIPQPKSGEAIIPFVPAGDQTLVANEASLPPYFQANGLLVSVPLDGTVSFPVTLPIGDNVPHRYMAFGDSITDGEGGYDDTGYRDQLADRLQEHFGQAQIINEGIQGAMSWEGARVIDLALRRWHPAYTLIMFGTNDWIEIDCVREFPCFTIDSLRTIIRQAKASHSLPFVATFPPGNPSDRRVPESRNEWASRMNALVRQLVTEEGAVLVEVHDAFVEEGDLTELFVDHVHPNDRGYDIITEQFFTAITQPRGGSSSS
jgi:lysophospholipase L1-like esterase